LNSTTEIFLLAFASRAIPYQSFFFWGGGDLVPQAFFLVLFEKHLELVFRGPVFAMFLPRFCDLRLPLKKSSVLALENQAEGHFQTSGPMSTKQKFKF
jgi:hypothetical protein